LIDLKKITMAPLVVYKKENGKFGIVNGHNKLKILRMIGITALNPEMYNYSDIPYNKDILDMMDIEDEIIN